HRFVHLAGSYHGETAGALAVTDVPVFRQAYAPLLQPGLTAPSPDARNARPGESAADVAERAAAGLEALLIAHGDEIAALIVEPLVQGACGMAMYDPAYLARARALCDRHRVHLIADEIAVGFGRTGTFLASEQAGIRPDFVCLSKGITGGFLPLAAVLTTDEVYAAFYDDDVTRGFLHSHSYTGNPLACAAALAVLDIFETDNVLKANRARAERWDALFRPLADHPQVRHYRHRGMIWAFDVADAPTGFAQAYFAAALAEGALLRPIGHTVYLMPPYTMNDDEARQLAGAARVALDAALVAGARGNDVAVA
ncbi:MAG TPA: aminotransferase class III-fold pyridoxal phosphate-dependent enzyme, partial [Chitinolyticbacter sp.]|nr:aminotransferase class III-fold pyridoxal phosphate-dependent enzyme [Chitinolyticbacter sp.]